MSFPRLNKKTVALLSIILIVTVWGSASAVTKRAVENTPPYLFAFLRNLVASASLVIFYLVQGRTQIKRPPLKRVIWMGLTGITFFYLFFNLALYYTTAASGALIQGFIPVSIILLAMIFLKERLKGWQPLGIILSVCGVVLIGFIDAGGQARDVLLGNVLMIFAVLSWGAYTILSKSMQQYDAVYLTMITTCIGTAGLVPGVALELINRESVPPITSGNWMAILYLGLFSSAICYVLYNRVVKVLSGVQVGNFMNLDPVVGAVIAVVALHERVSWWQVTGAALVLVGVALTSAKKEKLEPH